MIIDNISNASQYYSLGPRIKLALEYLQRFDAESVPPGRYEISGDEVFALVQDYATKPREAKRWEAHRDYIDVQFVASGSELMGYADRSALGPAEYDSVKDIEFPDGEGGEFLRVPAGTFVIFTPDDAHIPGVSIDGPEEVRKVVVKVRVGDVL